MQIPIYDAFALAALGGVALTLRRLRSTHAPESPFLIDTVYVQRDPALSRMMIKLERVDQPERLGRIISQIEELLTIVNDQSKTGMYVSLQAHRRIQKINEATKAMLICAQRTRNPQIIEACIECTDEVVSPLEARLDALLHNTLLGAIDM